MAYVRYKIPNETHDILKTVCKNLGMKESEFSRIALIEYLRSIKALEHGAHNKNIFGKKFGFNKS